MNTRTILYICFALLLGLLAGYLFFGGENHDHGMTAADASPAESAGIYTCSMHPQIQRDEPGDCPICGMDLIPLATEANADPTLLTMTEAAVALAQVRTTTVGTPLSPGEGPGERATAIRLTGRLALNEQSTKVQSINYPGRLESIRITYPGERVRTGQQIATVYSPELVVAQEELLEALKLRDLSPELVTAARNKLRNLKITDEQIAALEQDGQVVTNFPVYAERGGTVLEIRARVGDYVPAGGALYTLTDLDQLWALFDAYERDLAAISVGDRVTFTVASLPGEEFSGRVSFVDPLINAATRTAAVRAEVGNRGGRLKPQMFITGTIRTGGGRRAADNETLTVPATAVMWTGDRSVVYVEVPDATVPTYQFREITLGDRSGDTYRVTSGLEAGERIVTQGAFQLDAAAQLNNQASMMNRDVIVRGRESQQTNALVLPDYRESTPDAFQRQLGAVVEAYLPLKDRLITSEPAGNALLSPIRQALAAVDMSLLKEEQPHLYWMEQLSALQAHLGAVAGATSIEAQRSQFGFFSQALINTLTVFGVDETLYVQRCPMAFAGEGGSWLSEQLAIRNPYYGDAMLTCGSTIDTLVP